LVPRLWKNALLNAKVAPPGWNVATAPAGSGSPAGACCLRYSFDRALQCDDLWQCAGPLAQSVQIPVLVRQAERRVSCDISAAD
jgi:hypothetical protein